MNCLARVSRLYYPTLSLVSKRFRSLIASDDLYQTRTLSGTTESCLYLCIRFYSESNPRWFTLSRRLTQTPNPKPILNLRWFTSCDRPQRTLTDHTRKKEKKSSKNRMVSVQTRNISPMFWCTHAAIGSNIYMIGECFNNWMNVVSPSVFFMDCRYRSYHKAPSMRMAPEFPLVSVLDGKIYAVYINSDSSTLLEFFDPKTQIWEHLPNPSAEIDVRDILGSLVLEGKLYLFGCDHKKKVYKAKENKWDVVGSEIPLRWAPSDTSCVVDNVIYCYRMPGGICWFDSETRLWRFLKGLKDFPELEKPFKLVDYGGKIVVLWEKEAGGGIGPKKKKIWCAEISLERRNKKEIYGKIEWSKVVLTLSEPYVIVEVITATF